MRDIPYLSLESASDLLRSSRLSPLDSTVATVSNRSGMPVGIQIVGPPSQRNCCCVRVTLFGKKATGIVVARLL
jgi:hypothetical protein